MTIFVPFFELRSLLMPFYPLAQLEFRIWFPMKAKGRSTEQKVWQQETVPRYRGSVWQGGFLVPCLERGESQ
ncbi:MAG: hypothetical protein ACAF41_17260 [Leptolyngbya sp. BL-A-14]